MTYTPKPPKSKEDNEAIETLITKALKMYNEKYPSLLSLTLIRKIQSGKHIVLNDKGDCINQ